MMMKITVKLSKRDINHLKEGCWSEIDACSTVERVIKKVKKQIKESAEK